MADLLSDIIVPIVTFALGFGVENLRQARNTKREKISHIDNKLREFIEKTEQRKKTYLLKYDYNHIKSSVEQFCQDYSFDKCYFNDDLINLNIYSMGTIKPNKVSDISISIINRIREI